MLMRHEKPQKFKPKWFGPYQIVDKMALGTYQLHDPNGKELLALVHGNWLIKVVISDVEELKQL